MNTIDLLPLEVAQINISFPGKIIRTIPPIEDPEHPIEGRVYGQSTFDTGRTVNFCLEDAYIFVWDPGVGATLLPGIQIDSLAPYRTPEVVKSDKRMRDEYEAKHRGGQDDRTLHPELMIPVIP